MFETLYALPLKTEGVLAISKNDLARLRCYANQYAHCKSATSRALTLACFGERLREAPPPPI